MVPLHQFNDISFPLPSFLPFLIPSLTRFSQQDASLRSPSTSSLSSEGEGKLEPSSSMDSLVDVCPYQNCLSDEAGELIQFVSTRYMGP